MVSHPGECDGGVEGNPPVRGEPVQQVVKLFPQQERLLVHQVPHLQGQTINTEISRGRFPDRRLHFKHRKNCECCLLQVRSLGDDGATNHYCQHRHDVFF